MKTIKEIRSELIQGSRYNEEKILRAWAESIIDLCAEKSKTLPFTAATASINKQSILDVKNLIK